MSKARDIASAAPAPSTVSATELGYLDGVTSAIQTQINSKIGQSTAINPTIVDAKGDIIAATAADTVARLAVGTNNQVLTADSSTATGLKWSTPTAGPTFQGTFTTTGSINVGTMKPVYVVVCGGGGAGGSGGSGTSSTNQALAISGGHGGGSGYVSFGAIVASGTLNYTIGAGGVAPAPALDTVRNGGNGGTSQVGAASSSTNAGFLYGNGGIGGLSGNSDQDGSNYGAGSGGSGGGGSGIDRYASPPPNTTLICGSAGAGGSAGASGGGGGTGTPSGGSFAYRRTNGVPGTGSLNIIYGFALMSPGGGGAGGGGRTDGGTVLAGGAGGSNGGGAGGNGGRSNGNINNVTTPTVGTAGTNGGGGGGGGGPAQAGSQNSQAVYTPIAGGDGGPGFVSIYF